jgi:hypothetical protein
MILKSDLTHMERLMPTVEVTTPVIPTPSAVVVYDVEITDDITGTNPSAYAITIPGEMNYDDVSMTRKKRLAFVMGMWYIQSELNATILIAQDVLPNTMQSGVSYGIVLTDDLQLGRPHLYHPADTRYTYPYNIGSEIEDDKEKNNKPSRWDNIKETLRKLWNAKWLKTMVLLGMLFVIILLIVIGPIFRSCQPGIVAGSITTVTCTDGTQCEQFLYLGADCITYTYYCCTGELKGGTTPPGGLPEILPWVVGGGIAIGIIALLGILLSKKKQAAQPGAVYTLGGYTPPPVTPSGGAPYTPPPPPPVGSTVKKTGFLSRLGGALK